MMKSVIITSLFFIIGLTVRASSPEELGKVTWMRDMEAAQKMAETHQKPILILFQEIPGCSTCKNYGNQVLSHPLIVEAIESLFVPLVVYNNKSGKDAQWLNYFKEPSWNNPVVRIVDGDKKDVLPRLNGNYTSGGLVSYMMRALYLRGLDIPTYLTLMQDELRAKAGKLEKATFSMYCFWTGEKELGSLDGVVHTEAGFMDRKEVVNVYYNRDEISLPALLESGRKVQCADQLYSADKKQKQTGEEVLGKQRVKVASTFAPDREPKYYLSKTVYKFLPMSPIQAVKANAMAGAGKDPSHLFSPRQLSLLEHIKANPGKKWKNMIACKDWQKEFWSLSELAKV